MLLTHFVADATTDPVTSLVNYGALGVFAVVLIFVVKKLDDRNVGNYEARLKEKDLVIADKNETISDKDDLIDKLTDVLANHAVPAMTKGTQVLEAATQTAAVSIPQLDPETLKKLDKVLTHMEANGLS